MDAVRQGTPWPSRAGRALSCALLVLAVAASVATAPARASSRERYGAHSMLYLDSPAAFKARMFRETARMGAGWIRLDVAIPAIVQPTGTRDWSAFDDYVALARRYHLHVSAVLLGTPFWAADCGRPTPLAQTFICPASDPEQWASYAAEVAARGRGAIDAFEIFNEPDSAINYTGSAEDYARLLAATYTAIKRANPDATVLNGGVRAPRSRAWLAEVLSALHGQRAFDVANVHVRGRERSLGRVVREFQSIFRAHGFDGPLWVTEHGYPSATRWQWDKRFRGGTRAQTAYLRRSVPDMLHSGARKVFVTLRDNLHGKYSSEGLLGGRVADSAVAAPRVHRKPAAALFRRLEAPRHRHHRRHR
jgi:hypothetical protein